jgi:hypothetical protein
MAVLYLRNKRHMRSCSGSLDNAIKLKAERNVHTAAML